MYGEMSRSAISESVTIDTDAAATQAENVSHYAGRNS
jgi:hypothetical protein